MADTSSLMNHEVASERLALSPHKRQRRAPTGASDDCFSCQELRRDCDRERPFCTQCLQHSNSCSGYKTALTWNIGVASRGKLRGQSLPVALPQTPGKDPEAKKRKGKNVSGQSPGSSPLHREVGYLPASQTFGSSASAIPARGSLENFDIDSPEISSATAPPTTNPRHPQDERSTRLEGRAVRPSSQPIDESAPHKKRGLEMVSPPGILQRFYSSHNISASVENLPMASSFVEYNPYPKETSCSPTPFDLFHDHFSTGHENPEWSPDSLCPDLSSGPNTEKFASTNDFFTHLPTTTHALENPLFPRQNSNILHPAGRVYEDATTNPVHSGPPGWDGPFDLVADDCGAHPSRASSRYQPS